MTAYVRNFLIMMILAVVAVAAYNIVLLEQKLPAVNYSDFLEDISQGNIKDVHLKGGEVTGHDKYEQPFSTFSPDPGGLLVRLEQQGIEISTSPGSERRGTSSYIPWILVMGLWFSFMFFQKKNGGASGFSKTRSLHVATKSQQVSFADVAGIEEAKSELEEIVSFLRDPRKFTRLGGRLPRGVLLQGPPGTGKTLLAKAIAGEAKVPFFSISGSDFVEMFVGVGASRVRDLFKQAKKNAPCIIFIDEIDAVGGHRAAGSAAGGQDERQQTLNALLVEMDGFESDKTVVLIAATNRPDVLDPALLRPGRFDRQVNILPPERKGRLQILDVHARDIVMDEDLSLADIAAGTPGFTGAELANLVNESALHAARKGKDAVGLDDIEEAKDRIMMGAERKGIVITEEERRTIAYHESGHAILARVLPNTDPIHKITIIPRGRAMGMTQQVSLDDRHSYSKEFLTNRIKIMLGGRTAEEIVFNQFTTGASNDLQSATAIATRMVCEWGMSEKLGPRAYRRQEEQGFLGGRRKTLLYSEGTAQAIDAEINNLIEICYQEAVIILEGRIETLHKLSEALLEHETLDAEEVDIIVRHKGRSGVDKKADR